MFSFPTLIGPETGKSRAQAPFMSGRRRQSSGYFTYCAVAILLSLAAPAAVAADFAATLEAVRDAQAESRQVQESIDTLLGTDREATRRRLRSLESEIAALSREAGELETELAERRRAIEQLRSTGTDLRSVAAAVYAQAEAALRTLPPALMRTARSAIDRSAVVTAQDNASAAGDLASALSFATAVNDLAASTTRTTAVVELPGEPSPRRVTLLRFGLIASYYLADDASGCGLWQESSFRPLPAEDCTVLADVAEGVPASRELLRLPIPTPRLVTP